MSTTCGSAGYSKLLGVPNSLMSAPAKKVWPSQMMTTAFTASSPSAASIAFTSPSRTAWPSAFTGGLLDMTISTSPCMRVEMGLLIMVSFADGDGVSLRLRQPGLAGSGADKIGIAAEKIVMHPTGPARAPVIGRPALRLQDPGAAPL